MAKSAKSKAALFGRRRRRPQPQPQPRPSFRDELRSPLDRALNRFARRGHREEVDAIRSDPQKMARLVAMTDEHARRSGFRRRLNAEIPPSPDDPIDIPADQPAPTEGRFARLFKWIIEHQEEILSFIKAIIALFSGGMGMLIAKAVRTVKAKASRKAKPACKPWHERIKPSKWKRVKAAGFSGK